MRALLLLLFACQSPPADPPPAPEARVATADPDASLAEVEAAARRLGKTLKTRLLEEAKQGPAKAVAFCSLQAMPLTDTVKKETGLQVGRASTKRRNPANTGPHWVAAWLAAQGTEGAPAPIREVVDGEARVLLPLTIEGGCLLCHGTPEQIPDEVKAILAERYPEDQATGYAVGDLRGVIWASKPL